MHYRRVKPSKKCLDSNQHVYSLSGLLEVFMIKGDSKASWQEVMLEYLSLPYHLHLLTGTVFPDICR